MPTLLQKIKEFFAKRKEATQIERFEAGYNYAAGKLLKHGAVSVYQLESLVYTAECFDEFDQFDAGIRQALYDFKQLQEAMF